MAETVDPRGGEWLDADRSPWDERDEAFLATLDGLRVLHLQCYSGADSLVFVGRGARVVGIDVSKPAVVAARQRAHELGLDSHARFIEADLYDARHSLPEPESFDVVYTTRSASARLPDAAEWSRIVAWFLKPGGRLYVSGAHPAGDDAD